MKKKFSTLLYLLFLASIIGLIVFFYTQSDLGKQNPQTSLISPTPYTKSALPVSEGRQHYALSNVHHSPNFTDAWIDPELVRPGMEQKMTVHIVDTHPIVSVTATIQSDTKTQTYELSLVSGTNLDGEWSASWIVNDTHETKYVTDFKAINDIDEIGDAHISWSDPNINCDSCGTNATCTGGTLTGGADGADGGALTISGNITIPSGQTLVYGTSLTVNAALAISDGGQIRQGYITMTDADADNYPASIAYYYSATATPTAPLRRRSTASALNCYSIDCCEADNDTHPNQTACFAATNDCGSYDYDCSGDTTVCAGCTNIAGDARYCSANCSTTYYLATPATNADCGASTFQNTTSLICSEAEVDCSSSTEAFTVLDSSGPTCQINCQ